MEFLFDESYIDNSNHKICMFVANGIVGDSRVIKTADTLKKKGFDLFLIGIGPKKKVEVIEGYTYPVYLLPHPKHELIEQGIEWKPKGVVDYSVYTDIVSQSVIKFIEDEKIDFLHTHDMVGISVGGKITDMLPDYKWSWIHDIHEYVSGLTDLDISTRNFFYEQEKKYIKRPNALTCVSEALSSKLKHDLDLNKKPIVIHNSPRISSFDPLFYKDVRSDLCLKQDERLGVYCGNVKEVRGVDLIIEALDQLKGLHVAIITNSNNSYVEKIKNRVLELKITNRVHFLPYVKYDNLISYLRTADFGIHPIRKYPNAEIALPNKLFEYISAGVPVVVSNNEAMEAFVEEKQCGVVFKDGDPKSLCEAINLCISNHSQLSNKLKAISESYCWEKEEIKIIDIYEHFKKNKFSNHDVKSVLQLPTISAGQPNTLSSELSNYNLFSKSLVISEHDYGYEYDIVESEQKYGKESVDNFLKVIKNYDVLHYHSRTFFYNQALSYPSAIDLFVASLENKRVFFHYRGGEARRKNVFQYNEFNYIQENPNNVFGKYNVLSQKKFYEVVNAIADRIFVVDPELQTYAPHSIIVPRVIKDLNEDSLSLADINPSAAQAHIKIVHAPSNRAIKGTDYIESAITALKSKGYSIEFILVEKLNNKEAIEIYKKADIIVDQLRIGWFGVLAVEAMALGKPVVSYVRSDLRHYLPLEKPVMVADPKNIQTVLEYLINNPSYRQSLSAEGRKYYLNHHHPRKVLPSLIYAYKHIKTNRDYVKIFSYLNSGKVKYKQNERNNWTVKKSVNKVIASIQRDGLKATTLKILEKIRK